MENIQNKIRLIMVKNGQDRKTWTYSKIALIGCFFCLLVIMESKECIAQYKAQKQLVSTINKNYTDAAAQYKILMKALPAEKFPKTYFPLTNKYEFSNSGWWCSGFYPGTLLYIFEQTGDSVLYREAIRILQVLKKEQYNTGTHDLGFMIYCSFGNANRIHRDTSYQSVLINSAKSLSSRFDPKVGCIKSWNSKKNEYLVLLIT